MTEYRNTFEGGTNGVAVSGSNLGGSSGDQPTTIVFTNGSTGTFSTTRAAHGVLSVACAPSSTGGGSFSYGGLNSSAVASRIYMYLTALPTADTFILRHMNTAATPANVGILKFISTGALRIFDSTNATVWTSPATPPLNTWVRYDFFTDVANNRYNAAYSLLDSATPTATSGLLAGVGGGINVGRSDLGKVTGVYATQFWMDDIAVSDAATGFIAPGVPAGSLSATQTVVPSSGTIPFSVTATVTATGGTGSSKTYAWTWGDGGTTPAQASNLATHSFTTAGTYTVTCTVVNT